MAERGESRAIYTVITDDPDFLALSPYGKLVWYTLKMRLGVSGIDVASERALAEWTGLGDHEMGSVIGELFRGRWLVRERNVFWLRNGLIFDPYFTIKNGNHLKALLKHLRGLPKLGIVNVYADYYKLPLPFPGCAFTSLSNGMPMGTAWDADGYANQELGSRSKELGEKNSVASQLAQGAGEFASPIGGEHQPEPEPTRGELIAHARKHEFNADGTDADIIDVLLHKGVAAREIWEAIVGLWLMVKAGKYPKPGDGGKLSMRILYSKKIGKQLPAWTRAKDAYIAAENSRPPVSLAAL